MPTDGLARRASQVRASASIVRVALTVSTEQGNELLLALTGSAAGGCAAVNGKEVSFSDSVSGWLPLPLDSSASTQLVEFIGYGEGVGSYESDSGQVEMTLRWMTGSVLDTTSLSAIGEAELCSS